jgi:hypothetical protein
VPAPTFTTLTLSANAPSINGAVLASIVLRGGAQPLPGVVSLLERRAAVEAGSEALLLLEGGSGPSACAASLRAGLALAVADEPSQSLLLAADRGLKFRVAADAAGEGRLVGVDNFGCFRKDCPAARPATSWSSEAWSSLRTAGMGKS